MAYGGGERGDPTGGITMATASYKHFNVSLILFGLQTRR